MWNQREDQGTPPDQTNQGSFGGIGKSYTVDLTNDRTCLFKNGLFFLLHSSLF